MAWGLCRLFLDAPQKYRAVEVWRIPPFLPVATEQFCFLYYWLMGIIWFLPSGFPTPFKNCPEGILEPLSISSGFPIPFQQCDFNPNPGSCEARWHMQLPGDQSEGREFDTMPRPQSEVLRLHIERARDREGSSETAWCTNYQQGECPCRWRCWRQISPQADRNIQKQEVSCTY